MHFCIPVLPHVCHKTGHFLLPDLITTISGDALHCTIFSSLLLFHSFTAKYLPQHRFSDILSICYSVGCETVFKTQTKRNAEL